MAIRLRNRNVNPAPAVEMQPGQAGARVVVADDDVLLREGVASLLANSGYPDVDYHQLGFLDANQLQ